MKVFVCGGGTGGHVYPALAAIAELEGLGIGREQVVWLGVEGEMETDIVPRAGLHLETLPGGPIVGVPPLTRLKNGLKLMQSIAIANRLMGQYRPNVLLLTGGYISAPVALAARLRQVASLVYLPDLEPGSAIQTISRWVDRIACSFELSRQYFPAEKVVVTGYPVRAEMRAAAAMPKEEALAQFGLTGARPTLFVFGGSRGAWSINKALLAALPTLLQDFQVIHISGTLTWAEVEKAAAALPGELRAFYKPFPYLHAEMGAAFRTADLIVARAGASMLGEAPLFGTPSILVPYPHAWRYQKVNADYLAERGAAVRLNDEALEAELLPLVQELLHNKARLGEMAAAAAALSVPQAARNLAQLILDMGRKSHD